MPSTTEVPRGLVVSSSLAHLVEYERELLQGGDDDRLAVLQGLLELA